jgi:putative PIN family toxin of toxin-antitoxin system
MKVVLDTNVLISGIFFSGIPSRLLAAWADGSFELLATVEILTEYHRVADRLHAQFAAVDIKPVLDLITKEIRIVEPAPVPLTACDDQDDLKFLACALSGRAD